MRTVIKGTKTIEEYNQTKQHIEELAELLNGTPCNCCKLESNQNCSIPCLIGIKQWLESEVQGE